MTKDLWRKIMDEVSISEVYKSEKYGRKEEI